ncbi:hypothetical protein [Halomonas sp. BC04]|uniref:hypothetical protein n=1 Tax=Halomonas sp. BC04 TaxID=1403540 RepID=UPI0012DE513C|nr:hypothetical protein [Halomonas sp. BC04]
MARNDLERSTYREHYGFLWRDSEVEYDGDLVVFLDRQDVFAREPFSAVFQNRDAGTIACAALEGVTSPLPRLTFSTVVASATACRR